MLQRRVLIDNKDLNVSPARVVGYLVTFAIFGISPIGSHSAQADSASKNSLPKSSISESAFFPKNSVRDVWSSHADLVPNTQLEYFPRAVFKPIEEPEDQAEEPQKKDIPTDVAAIKPDPQATAKPDFDNTDPLEVDSEEDQSRKELEKQRKAQEIVEKFGDPEKETPILAVESAPGPMKGIQAALDANDDELAFKYARQYVRYMEKFKTRAKKFTSVIAVARMSEGLANAEGWENQVALPEDRVIGDEEAKKARVARGQSELDDTVDLDQRVLQLIEKTKKDRAELDQKKHEASRITRAESAEAFKAQYQNNLTPDQLREQVQVKYAAGVPVDPRGEVSFYVFFRMADSSSIALMREIESLRFANQGNKKLEILCFATDVGSNLQMEGYRAQNKINLPILDGEKLARELHIVRSPTMVVLAKNLNKAVFEEGIKRSEYLSELIRMVQGRKA